MTQPFEQEMESLAERVKNNIDALNLRGDKLMDIVLHLHYAYLAARKIMTEHQELPTAKKRKYERKKDDKQS